MALGQPTEAALRRVLRDQFGHEHFRAGQEPIIRSLLRDRDVLAVLPTGAGKSLVYQIAAQLLPGITVVVSPLLALMKDQVEALEAQDVAVSFINSTLSAGAAADELHKLQSRQAKLLYVTPERFENEDFLAEMAQITVSLFVVDEAHCVSEWGHSFRPSYLLLAGAVARLNRPVLLALTATATPWIRREIVERLNMRDPEIVVRGTDRPNLFFEVRRVEEESDDRRVLQDLLTGEAGDYPAEVAPRLAEAMCGSGIIYTATTKAARETATWLQSWGIAADYYHGQRKKADRERVQEAFMAGELRVIAATNAFGLGVDKPDVRFVVHRDIPASIEAYYQEAGRAGRDGDFARCTIIYRPADLGRAAFLAGGGELTRDELEQGWAGLAKQREGTYRELEAATGLGRADLARLVDLLKQHGVVQERRGRVRLRVEDFDPGQVSLEREQYRRAYEQSRLDMMRAYAEAADCRRRHILNYFGEEYEAERCDMCDNDLPRAGEQRVVITETEPLSTPFAIGDRVVHEAWGEGTVQATNGPDITVLFETAGYKTLAGDIVEQSGLLQRIDG
jgi:ATP-dependent DNA helicase RecQ